MAEKKSLMKKICYGYIKHVDFIATCYCVVPLLIWLGWILASVPFREVYLVRTAISLLVGIPIAIFFNRYGVKMWLIKHQSPKGPATILDGALLGSFVGAWTVMVPVFTSFIYTNNIEQAKTFIIACWIISVIIGAGIGAFIVSIGEKYIPRNKKIVL